MLELLVWNFREEEDNSRDMEMERQMLGKMFFLSYIEITGYSEILTNRL